MTTLQFATLIGCMLYIRGMKDGTACALGLIVLGICAIVTALT
jgi:hypothetical protein